MSRQTRTSKTDGVEDDVQPEPRRKVRLAPEARRRQILREATRLISQSGFNAVSLADIADACDIRKPSVLHYFPSMNDLLAAVLAYRDEQDFVVSGPRGLEKGGEPAAARAQLTRHVEHNLRQREIIRLHHMLGAEALATGHPAHNYFVARHLKAVTELQCLLHWKSDPAAAAVELVAFWDGLEMTWLRDPHLDLIAVWNSFCDSFFR